MSGFSKDDFMKYPPHDKVRISTLSERGIQGIRQLSQASMWKEILKLVANKEERFLLSYAVALQHIHAPEPAKVLLLAKVTDGHPFTLRLMRAYLMGGSDGIQALFELLFDIEREIKCMDSSVKTYFPVRMKTIEFLQEEKKKAPAIPMEPSGNTTAQNTTGGFSTTNATSSFGSTASSPTSLNVEDLNESTQEEEDSTSGGESTSKVVYCEKVDEEVTIGLLKQRELKICYYLINVFLEEQNIPMAIDLMKRICKDIDLKEDDEDSIKMISLLGLMYLSHGQVEGAQRLFRKIEMVVKVESVQILMNRAYIKFSGGKYTDAIQLFQKVVENDGSNIMAVNNLAVCHLYNKSIDTAIQLVENYVKKHPYKGINEYLVKNLVIFYSLKALTGKKKFLYELVTRFTGEDFPMTILK